MAGELKDPRVLLLWIKRYIPQRHRLSVNLLREVCCYLSPIPILTTVCNGSLFYFNFSQHKLDPPIPLKQIIPCRGCAWTAIDSDRVLYCGGYSGTCLSEPALKSAFELHRSGTVKSLKDMYYARDACGMTLWRGAVYVFGAMNGEGQINFERLMLGSAEWEFLGDMMECRACITPVAWLQALYLCGGIFTCTIEVFDGECLKLLPYELPEISDTIACVQEQSLVIFATDHITVLALPSGISQPAIKSIRKMTFPNNNTCNQLLLYDNKIYGVCSDIPFFYSAKRGYFVDVEYDRDGELSK